MIDLTIRHNFAHIITGIKSTDNMHDELRGSIRIIEGGVGSHEALFNLSCAAISEGYDFSLNFYGTRDDDDILCGSTRKFGDKINYFESKLQ